MKDTFLPILSHVSKSDGFDFFLSDTFLNLDGTRFTHCHKSQQRLSLSLTFPLKQTSPNTFLPFYHTSLFVSLSHYPLFFFL